MIRSNNKIGIFGGSFDPPHRGHLEISKIAIKKLSLAKLYWCVTKKNPFKNKTLFSLPERIKQSKDIAKGVKKIEIKSQHVNFIGAWNIENNNLCDEIITLFEESRNLQKHGVTVKGKDPTAKKTTDITIAPNDLQNIKFKCINNYID